MRLPLNLRILLLAFVSAGLIYDQATPIFEASDEAWHYGVVRELASGRGLPLQRVGELTTYRQEGSQPPLYHALGAALTFWVPDAEALRQSDYNPFAQVGVPGTYHNVNMVRHTQAEGFKALQKKKSALSGKCGASIAQWYNSAAADKGSFTHGLGVNNTVVGGVGFVEHGKTFSVDGPVKLA